MTAVQARRVSARAGDHDPIERWFRGTRVVVVLACLAGFSTGLGTTVLVISALGVVLLLAGLSQPRLAVLGVWLLVALDPFNKNGLIAAPIWRYNTLNALLVLMLLTQLPALLRRRDAHTAILFLLLAVMTVMLIGSPDLGPGIDQIVATAAPVALVAICARAGRDPVVWTAAAINTGILGAFAGPLYYLRGGMELNVNTVAFAFLGPLALVTAVAIAFPLTRRTRGHLLVLASFHVAWVFLTTSRGALLMALLALAFLALVGADAGQRLLLAVAAAAAVLVLVTQVTATQSTTLRRIEKLFDSEQTIESRTSGRTTLIRNGLEVFHDHPGGIGTGGFRAATAVVVNADPQDRDAHAAWVKILTENGVVGGALLAAYVLSFALAGRRAGRRGAWLGIATATVLAAGFTTSEFGSKGLWVLPAAATVLLHAPRHANEAGPSPAAAPRG
jgi:hypothetical protein